MFMRRAASAMCEKREIKFNFVIFELNVNCRILTWIACGTCSCTHEKWRRIHFTAHVCEWTHIIAHCTARASKSYVPCARYRQKYIILAYNMSQGQLNSFVCHMLDAHPRVWFFFCWIIQFEQFVPRSRWHQTSQSDARQIKLTRACSNSIVDFLQ